jgi:HpcH/HpaI aldolase/citrate lyase family
MFTHHALPGVQSGEQHDKGANEALLVLVQVESRAGVENVEGIAQVDGIDVLLIGECNFLAFLLVIRAISLRRLQLGSTLLTCLQCRSPGSCQTNGSNSWWRRARSSYSTHSQSYAIGRKESCNLL